jgi:hypothetical protein
MFTFNVTMPGMETYCYLRNLLLFIAVAFLGEYFIVSAKLAFDVI